MFRTISNFMRIADIRKKIVFTLLMLVIFRIGTFIPVPYTNKEAIDFMNQQNVFGFLNTFGGGALENFSIPSFGDNAIYYCIYYHAITSNGCCSEIC